MQASLPSVVRAKAVQRVIYSDEMGSRAAEEASPEAAGPRGHIFCECCPPGLRAGWWPLTARRPPQPCPSAQGCYHGCCWPALPRSAAAALQSHPPQRLSARCWSSAAASVSSLCGPRVAAPLSLPGCSTSVPELPASGTSKYSHLLSSAETLAFWVDRRRSVVHVHRKEGTSRQRFQEANSERATHWWSGCKALLGLLQQSAAPLQCVRLLCVARCLGAIRLPLYKQEADFRRWYISRWCHSQPQKGHQSLWHRLFVP